jgi:hypothetical protein
MLLLLLLFGGVGEVSLQFSVLGEEGSETAARLGFVEVEISLLLSLLKEVELEAESEVTAVRLNCVDVSAVDDTAVTNAAPIAPVGRADKRTLDCCWSIVVKGRLMGTREGSIHLLLCLYYAGMVYLCAMVGRRSSRRIRITWPINSNPPKVE